jgi:2-dehydropantoate 2-reductase
MRILVVGAGAIGGYFGGRLLEASRDVTFLVRPRRAAELARTGLSILSRAGDVDLPNPPVISEDALAETFDLVLLACKAYDLEGAMASFAPAVGPDTAILPLLNGIRHLEALQARFGTTAVLGGQCLISTTLDPDGRIVHLGDAHILTFGELTGDCSARVEKIAAGLSGARFEVRSSDEILQEMWEKWAFIATGACITCLMRAAIGDIVAAGAAGLATRLLDECAAIATAQGFPLRPQFLQRTRAMFTAPGSTLTASMLRDIERGTPIEADHILGDLLRRGGANGGAGSLLDIAFRHVKAYEARRARNKAEAPEAA